MSVDYKTVVEACDFYEEAIKKSTDNIMELVERIALEKNSLDTNKRQLEHYQKIIDSYYGE